jgi:hypothetical protein
MRKRGAESYLGGHSIEPAHPEAKGSWFQIYGPHQEPHLDSDADRLKCEAAIAQMNSESEIKRRQRREESENRRQRRNVGRAGNGHVPL